MTAVAQQNLSSADRRAQKEWVYKIKETSNMLYRSAAQAQRNFDQYLTAMEHVGAMYKEYGDLLHAAQSSFLNVQTGVEGIEDVKEVGTRLHICIHKWEHSEELYGVRNQLHMQTRVLKERSDQASKVLDECSERDELIKQHVERSAQLAKSLRKQTSDVDKLQKECDKLERKVAKSVEQAQRELDAMAIKSTATVLAQGAQFFKAMYKNGLYVSDRFSPARAGAAANDLDAMGVDAVTGVLHGPQTPRSEMSSIAPGGVYGQNYTSYRPLEAGTRVTGGQSNSGIPLRYNTNEAPAAA